MNFTYTRQKRNNGLKIDTFTDVIKIDAAYYDKNNECVKRENVLTIPTDHYVNVGIFQGNKKILNEFSKHIDMFIHNFKTVTIRSVDNHEEKITFYYIDVVV